MLRAIYFYILAFLITSIGFIGAQTTSSGNLVRVKFSLTSVLSNDTLGSWHRTSNQYGMNEVFYYAHLTRPSHSYLLKKFFDYWDSNVFHYAQGWNRIENDTSRRERNMQMISIGNDAPSAYLTSNTIIIHTSGGTWLIDGITGNSFIANNDSLYTFDMSYRDNPNSTLQDRLLYIPGMVGTKYLGVFFNDNRYAEDFDFRLIDLNDSPAIDSLKTVAVHVIPLSAYRRNYPLKLKQIYNNLYLVQTARSRELNIFSYSSDTLRYIKTLPYLTIDNGYRQFPMFGSEDWDFRNNSLYILSGLKLSKFRFNIKDTSFVSPVNLVEGLIEDSNHMNSFSVDPNFKFLARILNNKLDIFDIDNSMLINTISLEGIKNPSRPFIDSPYVYIHQQNYYYTGVNDKNGNEVLNSYSISAYPNPFNSSAKISYSLPEDKYVEITIYDIMGKKLTTLVKDSMKKGDHVVLFEASRFPSGIYFYNLTTDNYNKTGKLILMK